MKKIRLIIVEDNRLQREGIKEMIKGESDFNLVAALGDTVKILNKIQELKPNVMLLDLSLANIDSLELVHSIKKEFPETKVIVMDLVPAQEDILKFVEAGASGFILKDTTIPEFMKTIRTVAGGEKVLPPILAGSLFSQIIDYGVKELGPEKLVQSVRMTKREREVVVLISDGLSNKEIAYNLNLSIYTVKSHVHNILEKMALSTRVQIAIHTHSGDVSNSDPENNGNFPKRK